MTGGEITVNGSGFDTTSPGIYLGIGPAGLGGFYAGSASLLSDETVWIALGNPEVSSGNAQTAPMNTDGSFSVRLTIPAPNDSISRYAIYTSKAHGQGFSDPSQNTSTTLNYATSVPAATHVSVVSNTTHATLGSVVTLTATVSPDTEGSIEFRDQAAILGTVAASSGVATYSTGGLAPGGHAVTASCTPENPTAYTHSISEPLTITVNAAPIPTVMIATATDLDPDGSALVLSGIGFASAGSGFYLGVGPKAALNDPDWYRTAGYFQAVAWATSSGRYGVTIHPDGTFSATLNAVTAVFSSNGRTVDCRTEECGVFTFASGGSTDRSQDTYTPLTFANQVPGTVRTSLALRLSSASSVAGDLVEVTATVTPAAAGTITLFDHDTAVAHNLRLRPDGDTSHAPTASVTTRLNRLEVGTHSFSARFLPDDTTAFSASASTGVDHPVTAAPTVVKQAVSNKYTCVARQWIMPR